MQPNYYQTEIMGCFHHSRSQILVGVKVNFEFLELKLKLKLNPKSDKMSVKIVPLLPIVRSDFASIVIYRVLQFILKAIEILLFFGSVEPVHRFLLLYGLQAK